jgi:general stress protein 26
MAVNIKTIESLIDLSKTSIISSVDESGFPNVKAMLPPRLRQGLKEFYFTTNTSSMRVKQFVTQHKASIYFFDNITFKGVMLIGNMEVMKDEETKKMIWKNGDELYYSKGIADPDYCVLKFTSSSGRFYSNFSSENFVVEQ